jgi:ribose transport system permease protein
VVGGTSLMGGRGSIVGTFFGALIIGLLYNAMNLLGVDSYLQKVVLGAVILLAVVFDELRKRYLSKALLPALRRLSCIGCVYRKARASAA